MQININDPHIMPNIIKAYRDRVMSNVNGLRETLCQYQHLSIKIHDINEQIGYRFYQN